MFYHLVIFQLPLYNLSYPKSQHMSPCHLFLLQYYDHWLNNVQSAILSHKDLSILMVFDLVWKFIFLIDLEKIQYQDGPTWSETLKVESFFIWKKLVQISGGDIFISFELLLVSPSKISRYISRNFWGILTNRCFGDATLCIVMLWLNHYRVLGW